MANRDSKGAYISWRRMRQRLNHRENYAHLDMDPRWNNFKNFLADMGERPEGLTLERVDNNSGYWPWNCRWATMKEQSNNRKAPELRIDNSTGIAGVRWHSQRERWIAAYFVEGKENRLYYGPDFFEACCARKSWEAVNKIY